jgi:dipeptidyl aminopeptidase/acylaminoacyl peptidase
MQKKSHIMIRKFYTLFLLLSLSIATQAQERMSAELLWKLGRVSLQDVSPDGKTALYTVRSYEIAENAGTSRLYSLDMKTQEASELPYIGSARFMQNGEKIGGVVDGQYGLANSDGSNWQAISNLADAGNFKAVELTDGRIMLLFTTPYKYKATTADNYPELPEANALVIDDLMYRHWDHWNDAFVDHLCYAIYNPEEGAAVDEYVDIMNQEPFDVPIPPFGGSEQYTASPDGQFITYSCKKMTGKDFAISTNSDIYLYTLETGKTSNLTKGMMGYDNLPQFSPDGTLFSWVSMPQDGYESDVNQLWIYDLATHQKSQPLSEEYVQDYQWVDNSRIAYLVPKQATQQIGIIELEGKDGKRERLLTQGDYNYRHFIMRNSSLVAERQDMNHATEIFSIGKKGKATQVSHVNDALYSTVEMAKIEKRMVKTSDGKDMLTWVIYPPGFDESKTYPTLLYCQGGPQSAVSQFYSFRWNFQLMAAHDYIIVAPNRRGLPGFGKEWNEAISLDWGGQAMRDYLSAIDALAAEPYVDENRLGAVGASYGGYSVYMLAGIHENRFKALISHCGLFNLESWYGVTEELFFANWDVGGPYWMEPTPKSYLTDSPHKYVQNWTAPILVIHGGKDFRVPENQGMEAFQAAQIMGIPSRFLYFPEESHWVLSPQNGLIWHTEYFKWLDQWLK